MKEESTYLDKLLHFLIFFFIYLIVAAFPWRIIISERYLSLSLRLVTGAIFLIALIIFLHLRYPRQKCPFSIKTLLLFLPFFIIPFSNLASSVFTERAVIINHPDYFALTIISTTIFAISEELLFRRLLIPLLLDRFSEIKAIALSSLLFALLHILNIFGGVDFGSGFLQVLYSFGVGFICGMMYVYGDSLLLPILFHALFNILQNDVYEAFYPYDYVTNLRIYTTIGIVIFALAYSFFILVYYGKKNEYSSSLNKQDR